MGQCYLMALELKGDFNKAEIVKRTAEFMKYRSETPDSFGLTVNFCRGLVTEDMGFEEALKVLFGRDVYQAYRGREGTKCTPILNGYLICFDGSYSWGEVVENWFEYIAPAAGEGTEFYLEPDHGHTDAVVKDGKAIFTYHY